MFIAFVVSFFKCPVVIQKRDDGVLKGANISVSQSHFVVSIIALMNYFGM